MPRLPRPAPPAAAAAAVTSRFGAIRREHVLAGAVTAGIALAVWLVITIATTITAPAATPVPTAAPTPSGPVFDPLACPSGDRGTDPPAISEKRGDHCAVLSIYTASQGGDPATGVLVSATVQTAPGGAVPDVATYQGKSGGAGFADLRLPAPTGRWLITAGTGRLNAQLSLEPVSVPVTYIPGKTSGSVFPSCDIAASPDMRDLVLDFGPEARWTVWITRCPAGDRVGEIAERFVAYAAPIAIIAAPPPAPSATPPDNGLLIGIAAGAGATYIPGGRPASAYGEKPGDTSPFSLLVTLISLAGAGVFGGSSLWLATRLNGIARTRDPGDR
jgi:hypothetical protein